MISPTQRFDWNGTGIAWDTIGSGPSLVLIHGTPFSSHVWHRIVPELARGHQLYFYDLPGYGQSDKRAGQDVSLGIQNKALAAMLAFWKLERPKVIAHDFGGATALRAHLIDGCDYERLLLIDPVAVRPWGSPFVQHVRHHESAFAGVPDYIQAAILKAYVSAPRRAPCRRTNWNPMSRHGWGQLASRLSTARSPRWISVSPTRSNRFMPNSAARWPCCGEKRIAGYRCKAVTRSRPCCRIAP